MIGADVETTANLPAKSKPKTCRVRLPKTFRLATRCDLRRSTRYPVELELTYTVFFNGRIVDTGSGRSVDWSSAGMRFTAERPIKTGRKIEVAARWPVALDNGVALSLVVSGKTVRATERESAMRIDHYQFRTRKVSSEAPLFDAVQRVVARDMGRAPVWAAAGNVANRRAQAAGAR